MAVVNETGFSGPLYANGVTTVFPFDFTAASADEIEVTVDGIAIGAGKYVVTLAGDFTGSVTISPALAAGEIYIYSVPNFKQEAVFQRFGPFYPDQTNAPFDRAAIRDIWLKRQLSSASASVAALTDALEVKGVTPSTFRSDAASTAPNKGAALIGALGFNAAASTVQDQLDKVIAKTVSVRDYGATQDDGTTPQQSYFSDAAQAAQARITTTPAFAAMPQAPTGEVFVPDGLYHLTADIDTGGKNITWFCADGARFTSGSAAYLLGKVVRNGRRSSGAPFGYLDSACGDSVMVGGGSFDNSPLVSGFTNPNQISTYETIDIVGRYSDATSLPLTHQSAATFTATACVLASAAPIKKLRVGMVIQTTHSPWYRGQITGWSSDGLTITVANGWYQQGSTAAATPSNSGSPQALINPFHKVWAKNSNAFLPASGYGYQAAGHEIGVWNDKVTPATAEDEAGQTWGNDVVNLGPRRCAIGHMTRGDFWEGFRAAGTQIGYNAAAFARYGYATPAVGYNYDGNGVAFRQRTASGAIQATISNGALELGDVTTPSTPYIDFRSSGGAGLDHDARIIVSGGGGTVGNGGVQIIAAEVATNLLKPSVDNVYTLGASGYRWSVVWAATGTISTSDPRLKRFIDDADMWAAAKRAVLSLDIKPYQWLDAIAEKGDDARIHIGVNAQQVLDAFAAEGLDAHRFGLFCEDPEIETVEVITQVEVPATEWVEEEQTVQERVGDGIVLRKRTVSVEKPKTLRLPVLHDDGSPVQRPRYGPPLFPELPDARPMLIGFEDVYADVPVMTTKDVVTYLEQPTGLTRLGIRYEQMAMLMIAAMRATVAA